MAEKRKLFAEVDKCFKRIDEGVELFEEIMRKVQEANSDNQREKYQDDLKKEIKKLQRLRDQVKVWQTSSDIKDKERLNHYRKVIEQRMEQFKDIERENKTKPHSKQGLCAEEKLDPKEKEKSDMIDWLQSQLREINDDSDRTEMQIESLSTAEGGKRRGKKEDSKKGEKERKIEILNGRLEKLKFHVGKLEIIMRMINNESLEPKRVVEVLKEPMESWTEVLQPDYEGEPEDFETLDPEDCYEELDLHQLCAQLGTVAMNSVDDERENGHESGSPHESEESKSSRHGSTDTTSVNTPSSPAPRRTTSVTSNPVTTTTTAKIVKEPSAESPVIATSSPTVAAAPPPPPGIPYNSVAAGRVQPTASATPPQSANSNSGKATFPIPSVTRQPSSQAATTNSVVSTPPATSASTTPVPSTPSTVVISEDKVVKETVAANPPVVVDSYANITRTVAGEKVEKEPSVVKEQPPVSPPKQQKPPLQQQSPKEQQPQPQPVAVKETSPPAQAAVVSPQHKETKKTWDNNNDAKPSPVLNGPSANDKPSSSVIVAVTTPEFEDKVKLNAAGERTIDGMVIPPSDRVGGPQNEEANLRLLRAQLNPPTEPQTAHIPAWLGASPLGRAPSNAETDVHLTALETAFGKSHLPYDSERPRTYLPRIANTSVPSYYPQAPPPNGDTLEYYLRLTPDTLFFIFYYMEGTKAQLLAAKALKKLSWRFHTKYLTWFQRHEEPKQITDDYEQGTYVYFDFEKWSQRKKEQFTFEYRFLEDKDFE